MKKYLFIIAGLILLFNSSVVAQNKAPIYHRQKTITWKEAQNKVRTQKTTTWKEQQAFTHDMRADSSDRWAYSGGQLYRDKISVLNFNVWVKLQPIDKIHYFFSYTDKGDDLISAELYNIEKLELATTSITPANVNKYKYKVTANDSIELVPWKSPSVFRSNKFTSYAYLGKFDCKRKKITLTIAEKNNEKNQAIYEYKCDDKPPVKLSSLMIEYPTGLSAKSSSQWNKGFTIWSVKNPISIILDIESTSQNELYHVYVKRDGDSNKGLVGNNWEKNFTSPDPQMRISSSYFNKAGKYTIIIRPEMAMAGDKPAIIGAEFKAHFTVSPAPTTIPVKTVGYIILIIVTTAGFMFVMYRRRQKIKLATEARNKQIATLQLQSVRSQLNPHFIFNALAGVQNLMNKNEVENANKYLARFARLTRNVLDDGQKELTSIEHEVSLLSDYLEMEQMRFGFKFTIDLDSAVDQQIEIPAMLLQPFAENAVKHGISALKDEGLITVNINQTRNDIVLKVADNGGGFANNPTPGMGIKLCEERVELLNSIYKNSTILLNINPAQTGTIITIQLKNWL